MKEGGGMRKWKITVAVWRVHPASHDSLLALLKITHSSASRVGDVRRDPGVPAWSCVSSLLLQLHRRIYSTLPPPSIAFPLPSSWPRTFIFIIGKSTRAEEAEARKSRSAGSDLWAVFFFWRNHRNLRWFQLTEEEKKKCWVWLLFYPLRSLSFLFWPPHAFWEIWIKFKIHFLTWT